LFFEDREVIYQEVSPTGRWRLIVYAPVEVQDGVNDEDELPPAYFAEFEKTSGINAVGFPFGGGEKGAELEVDWSIPGKVCALSLDGKRYLLFKLGVCFLKPREINKLESEGPITDEEAAPFLEAALKENREE
jgi:hypothetical protein